MNRWILSLFVLSMVLVLETAPVPGTDEDEAQTEHKCEKESWVTFPEDSEETCQYKQKGKLGAFLISFLLGGVGGDWFFLSRGGGGYIFAGIIKLITGGGFGIWWIGYGFWLIASLMETGLPCMRICRL